MVEQKDTQTYAIIGAAIEVYKQLGSGFLEAVYQEALAIELASSGIANEREVPINISYKGTPLSSVYRGDFICYGEVIVEIKANNTLSNIEEAQVLHYLKATGMHRALLINFGSPSLQTKRLVNDYEQSK